MCGIQREIKKNTISWGQSWRSGTRCDCKTDWLWVWSPLEEMKYLLKFIFPFLRSGVEAKRGVEYSHSTRNASRIRQKVGNGSVLTLGFLCLPSCVRDTAWSWFNRYIKIKSRLNTYTVYKKMEVWPSCFIQWNNKKKRKSYLIILFLYINSAQY